VIANPVRTTGDVDALRPFCAEEAVGSLLDAIRLIRRDAAVPLIGFAGAPFTVAAYLAEGRGARDADAMKQLLHVAPETAERLLDRLVDMTVAYLGAQVAAGVQAVQLFDSWIGALGPFDYERAVLPHMRRLFAALSELGVPTIHFGTGTAGLLALQAAGGGDVIGVDWRIALGEAAALVPGRAVQGNLDPAVLLGPWERVEAAATDILSRAAGRPGHIFNLGHGVLPRTDPEQISRLARLIQGVPSVA